MGGKGFIPECLLMMLMSDYRQMLLAAKVLGWLAPGGVGGEGMGSRLAAWPWQGRGCAQAYMQPEVMHALAPLDPCIHPRVRGFDGGR